ncbi:MAG: hypothetical protein AAGH49_04285 [Pseudomonadota bacterium]
MALATWSRAFGTRALALSILAIFGCPITMSADTEHPVRYLHLQNDGHYVITDIELKWITPDGKRKSNKFTHDLEKAEGFCLDLEKFGGVPDGSEVWLKAYIALGDNESCRKDNPRIYKAGFPKTNANYVQQYKMGGQTLTNNMCKLSSGTEGKAETTNDIGNSTDCPES